MKRSTDIKLRIKELSAEQKVPKTNSLKNKDELRHLHIAYRELKMKFFMDMDEKNIGMGYSGTKNKWLLIVIRDYKRRTDPFKNVYIRPGVNNSKIDNMKLKYEKDFVVKLEDVAQAS